MENKLLTHEVLDRSQVVASMFAQYVREHPVVESDAKLSVLADNVLAAFVEFSKAAFEL